MTDIKALADEVLGAIREYVDKRLSQIPDHSGAIADLKKELDGRFGALPVPENGKDGTSVTLEDVRPLVEELVSAIRVPENGKDGASVTVEDVKPILESLVAEIPPPKEPPSLDEVVAAIEPVVAQKLEEAAGKVDSAIAAIPEPKHGKDGKDGEDGRDALSLEIVDLDVTRSYPRGIYGTYKGGLIRSLRATDPLEDVQEIERAGWQIVVNGLSGFHVEQKDARTFEIQVIPTVGKAVSFPVSVPAMVYKGIWREGTHEKGDCVTWGGSLWHCNGPTEDKPGTSEAWTLSVKRGADGKDGRNGIDKTATVKV